MMKRVSCAGSNSSDPDEALGPVFGNVGAALIIILPCPCQVNVTALPRQILRGLASNVFMSVHPKNAKDRHKVAALRLLLIRIFILMSTHELVASRHDPLLSFASPVRLFSQ